MSTVGIVGVGNMGGGMAQRLLACGWQVAVCDLDPARAQFLEEKGAVQRATPGLCAMDSVATIVCVVDAGQTETVLFGADGIAQTARPGSAVLLCPTIAPQDTESFAARLSRCGLHPIDAPMSGGPQRAMEGTMSLMVACADAVFEANRALLETLSCKMFRVGARCGDGARTKLVNNLLAGINLAGAAEALALARRMGLDPARTLDVMEQSSGQSWIASDRLRRAIVGDYAPRAHATLLAKDTRLALEAALAAGFDVPLGGAAQAQFARAIEQGLGMHDDAVLYAMRSGAAPAAKEM